MFKADFKAAIESKPISTTDKLLFLTNNLTNQPAKLLENLPINEANYVIAWEKLGKQYSDPSQLI